MHIRIILPDQLNLEISSLQGASKNDLIFISENSLDLSTIKFHKKRIAFNLSAMRHFSKELEKAGYDVLYKYRKTKQLTTLSHEIKNLINDYEPEAVTITAPSEYRVLKEIEELAKEISTTLDIKQDDHFLCSTSEFKEWSKNKKALRMENFYRYMRKKHNILMYDKEPEGGKWNFDSQNRQTPDSKLKIPASFNARPDKISNEVIKLVETEFADHFGDIDPFYFAVTRKQALEALELFINERLSKFGAYQDAMIEDEAWMLHSHISFYLNIGLLVPMECIKRAELAYERDEAPLNSVEGFIRQILGWREYIRGIYWLKMPEYEETNFFKAKRPLPDIYWGKKTKMNCLSQCVKETKANAYAHHIQRLMVLGNFALICAIDPKEVNYWYMVVYADSYQWVELPNVTGMILFADGGVISSKPYAASGSYINKMSNYCKNCTYKISKKNGPDACPFNYLYWNFIIENREKLKNNHRMSMIYRILDKMNYDKIQTIKNDSELFLAKLNKNEK